MGDKALKVIRNLCFKGNETTATALKYDTALRLRMGIQQPSPNSKRNT